MENKKYIIDARYEREEIIKWIKKYFVENGNANTKAVIGISGGKDSTIAAALLVRALGPERVIGVLMPNNRQSDIEDSYNICNTLGIQHYTINIGDTYKILTEDFINRTGLPLTPTIETNTPARLRMVCLYMVAAAVGGRVCCTGNASEKYVGYTTKYGDLAGDFALFTDYYVRDVLAIGDTMEEIPRELVHKIPSDGMSGYSDEERLGFRYETLDSFVLDDVYPNAITISNIDNRHKTNLHKDCIRLPHPRVQSRHSEDITWTPDMKRYWSF
jgi:NAD+ synthase